MAGGVEVLIPYVEVAAQHTSVQTSSFRTWTANVGRIQIHEAVAPFQGTRFGRSHVFAHGHTKTARLVGVCFQQVKLDRFVVQLETHVLVGIDDRSPPVLLTQCTATERQGNVGGVALAGSICQGAAS